ncbi:MAG: acyltransferase [Gammaproteobacteria bacterium]|nr:acyltransferase [Gammaproteobacteria bacterium]
MLHFLPAGLRGALAIVLLSVNTLILFGPLMLVASIKLLIPVVSARKGMTIALIGIANTWLTVNSLCYRLLNRVEWHIEGTQDLSPDEWYLVICNHQSWADIPVLQHVFLRKIPMLKFFLKKQLIWVPLLGIAWWALDFPFMHRHTRAQLAKDPSLRGKDLDITRKACEKFRYTPVTIFNFLEGTRFTPAKHDRQQSPYAHLLKPKAGGAAFVLGAMGDEIRTLLDVTLVYPNAQVGFWDYLCGRMPCIVVHVEKRPIPAHFLNRDYMNDEAFREAFQAWVGELWQTKDKRISALHERYKAY